MNYNDSDDFYKYEPLTQDECMNYFLKYKKGDKEAYNTIIKHNMRLVRHIVSKEFIKIPIDKEELISTGLLGLVECLDKFDPSLGYKFSTYFYWAIYYKIIDFIRKSIRNQEVHINDEEQDFIPALEDEETKVIIKGIINNLPSLQKEIVLLYYGFNGESYSKTQISKTLKISRSRVRRQLINALIAIKLKLEEENIIESNCYSKFNTRKI